MEKYVDLFKRHVVNFKLELCCFMASVRSGLLAFTCLNMAIGMTTLMFFAEGSIEPLLLKVLNGISEAPPNYGPTCIIVYAIELGSNVIVLCGMMRNDLVLLRAYLYYALGVLMAALMVYTMLFKNQSPSVECLIVASIGYQIYIILLVRSAMIEIKQTSNKNEYSISYRQSSVRYSRPGSRDRYSVMIEPYRPRGSLVPLVVKDNNRRNSAPPIIKQAVKREVKEANVIVHSPKHIESKEVVTNKEDSKDGDFKKVVVKEGTSKEGTSKGAIKEETAKEATGKEAKEEAAKDVKQPETKKRKRSFFGRKEKKKDESLATNES